MSRPVADAVDYGTIVVAALLFFAAFVALFRRDLGDPLVAAAVFAGAGVAVRLAGRLVRRAAPASRD